MSVVRGLYRVGVWVGGHAFHHQSNEYKNRQEQEAGAAVATTTRAEAEQGEMPQRELRSRTRAEQEQEQEEVCVCGGGVVYLRQCLSTLVDPCVGATPSDDALTHVSTYLYLRDRRTRTTRSSKTPGRPSTRTTPARPRPGRSARVNLCDNIHTHQYIHILMCVYGLGLWWGGGAS